MKCPYREFLLVITEAKKQLRGRRSCLGTSDSLTHFLFLSPLLKHIFSLAFNSVGDDDSINFDFIFIDVSSVLQYFLLFFFKIVFVPSVQHLSWVENTLFKWGLDIFYTSVLKTLIHVSKRSELLFPVSLYFTSPKKQIFFVSLQQLKTHKYYDVTINYYY